MNREIIAKLIGVSKREIYYVAAGQKKNDDIAQLLTYTDESYIRQWIAGAHTQAMCVLAKKFARIKNVRLFATRLLRHAELVGSFPTLGRKIIQQSYKYMQSPRLESVCETAIMHTQDNDMMLYIADLHTINRRLRGLAEEGLEP